MAFFLWPTSHWEEGRSQWFEPTPTRRSRQRMKRYVHLRGRSKSAYLGSASILADPEIQIIEVAVKSGMTPAQVSEPPALRSA